MGVGFIAYYLWNQNQQLKEQNAATIAQQSISQDLPSTTQQVAKTDFYTLTTIGERKFILVEGIIEKIEKIQTEHLQYPEQYIVTLRSDQYSNALYSISLGGDNWHLQLRYPFDSSQPDPVADTLPANRLIERLQVGEQVGFDFSFPPAQPEVFEAFKSDLDQFRQEVTSSKKEQRFDVTFYRVHSIRKK